MKKSLVIVFSLLMIIPPTFADIYIENDRQYVGKDGAFHVVGEIHNGSDVPLNQVTVLITLYDINNHIIAIKETESLVNIIMPTMKAPFDLVLTGPDARQTNSYTVDAYYKISHPKNQVIDITSSEIMRDNYDNLVISGMVANKGEITANMVSVVATLYDKDGNVAAVTQVNPEPDYLRVDDEAFFLMSVTDKTQTDEIVDYLLVAESEEYAAVPEFPIGSLVLLAGSVSTYIGITRYSGRVITNLISATNPK